MYHFDSEKNQTVESKPVQGVMDLSEDNKVLSLKAAAHSDYVLVISYEENYKELGYTAKIVTAQPQETEAETETESEPEKLLLASVRLELDSGFGDGSGCIFRVSEGCSGLFRDTCLFRRFREAAGTGG